MSILESVNEDINKALLNKERDVKLFALYDLKRFLKSSTTLESEMNNVKALIRSGQSMIETYIIQQRNDLADFERQKISIFEQYLPPKLTEKELEAAVEDIIVRIGAQKKNWKDLHKVKKAALEELKEKAYEKNITIMVDRVMIYH